MQSPFDGLLSRSLRLQPFRHLVTTSDLHSSDTDLLLRWLETSARWEYKDIPDFYAVHSLNMRHQKLPEHLLYLVSEAFQAHLSLVMSKLFEVDLSPRVDVQAQKMVAGERIGIHTDYGSVGQSHRLLIQLNRGWSASDGGYLMLFDNEAGDIDTGNFKAYLPVHGSVVAFEISPASFHAVSAVVSGVRYTLSFSFRTQ